MTDAASVPNHSLREIGPLFLRNQFSNFMFDLHWIHRFGPAKASAQSSKFDQTIEAAFRLGTDPRRGDHAVRGAVTLPHGTGAAARVAVFADGVDADAARAAGGMSVEVGWWAARRDLGFNARRLDPPPCSQAPTSWARTT